MPALRWDPPRVDAPIVSLSTTPACSLPDVLNQAGQRAEELVDHLQNFIAHEQIRYDSKFVPQSSNGFVGTETIRRGETSGGESLTAKFDYVVDFGGKSGQMQVHEFRKPLPGTNNEYLRAILDKGLPVLALIFRPALQSDYEMRCEGSVQWHNQPTGCATWKGQSWPAGLPIVVEFAAVTAATDGDDRIGAANGPEHSGAFETGGDEGFATRFDHS